VSEFHRVRRQQLLCEAEGCLDLIMVFADRWPPTVESRDRLANRALELLSKIRAPGADRGYLLYLKGQALRAMERFNDAIWPLAEAAEDDPGNTHIWLALGWCYKRTGRLDLAIEALDEAVSADPDQAIVHYNLACYWSLFGNVTRALNHLSTSFEMDSNFRELVPKESDFDPIRGNHQFRTLTSVIV